MPCFRKSFNYKSGRATIKIVSTGFYRLYLNGKDITKGELSPYISNPDHIVYLEEYDVTDLLSMGENAAGIILGNSFANMDTPYWGFDKNSSRTAPKFAFSLEVDGIEQFDGQEFLWSESPYYFDDLRSGVVYDARKEI